MFSSEQVTKQYGRTKVFVKIRFTVQLQFSFSSAWALSSCIRQFKLSGKQFTVQCHLKDKWENFRLIFRSSSGRRNSDFLANSLPWTKICSRWATGQVVSQSLMTIIIQITSMSRSITVPTTRSPIRSPALPRFELICATFFSAYANSAWFPSFWDRYMSTSICWELTCDGLVSHPEGVKDFHLLNTTEIGDNRWLHGPLCL